MKRTLKPVTAVLAALGLVTVLATPSGAATITGGTLTIATPTALVFPLAGVGTCAPSTITMADGSTGTGGTISISVTQAPFTLSGADYVLAATFTGTYSLTSLGGTSYGVTAQVNMVGQIRDAPTPCASTGSTKCSALAVPSLALTGTATLSSVHSPVGPVTLSSNSRPISAFGCTSTFSSLFHTRLVTISSLAATLP